MGNLALLMTLMPMWASAGIGAGSIFGGNSASMGRAQANRNFQDFDTTDAPPYASITPLNVIPGDDRDNDDPTSALIYTYQTVMDVDNTYDRVGLQAGGYRCREYLAPYLHCHLCA